MVESGDGCDVVVVVVAVAVMVAVTVLVAVTATGSVGAYNTCVGGMVVMSVAGSCAVHSVEAWTAGATAGGTSSSVVVRLLFAGAVVEESFAMVSLSLSAAPSRSGGTAAASSSGPVAVSAVEVEAVVMVEVLGAVSRSSAAEISTSCSKIMNQISGGSIGTKQPGKRGWSYSASSSSSRWLVVVVVMVVAVVVVVAVAG